MEMGHTHVQGCSQLHTGSLQTAPAGQCHQFSTSASQCSFSLLPRDLVFSDLPPVCIRKERLHCPARSWYLISLQALGANPTTSCLCSGCCGCGGVCTGMHISLHWLPSLTCSAQEQNRILAQAGSIVQLPTSASTLFSRNYILHFYFKHISCQSRSPKTLVPRCSHSPRCGRAFSTGIWLMKH